MKLITLIFLVLITFSCNLKYDEYNEFDDMYNILCGDFQEDISYLTESIDKQMELISLDSVNYNKANQFHKLTVEYNRFLEQIEVGLMEVTQNPFYHNNSITELGKEYLKKKDLYREQILFLITSEELIKLIKYKLRSDTPQNRNGERIEHMDYYFNGITRSGTFAYLKNKRRTILAIENEFLNSLRHN